MALALPMLDAMIPAMANAQQAAAAVPPKRLGFVIWPHGIIHEDWMPKETGAGYTMTKGFDALEPNRGKLNVISGLACDPSRTRQGFHDRAVASVMTGVEKSKAELRVDVSIDQVAAQALGKETAFTSLELAGEQMGVTGGTVFKTPTQPLPFETSPSMLFERMFGDAERVDSVILEEIRHRQQSMLDYLSEEVTGFRRNLGASDKLKLEEYLQAVRDVERRLAFTEKLAEKGIEYERPPNQPASYSDRINTLFDLQALALQTDMTRVFTMMMVSEGSNMTFPEIGWNYSFHQTTHHLYDKSKMAAITRINNYQAGMFNRFLTTLDSIDEGNGSVLDNSLILYASNLGDSNNHMQVDLPVILAGGGNMGIQGDRHIALEMDTPITNLYLQMLGKVGIEMEEFGDSTGVTDV